MKKNYFILAFMLLSLILGQKSYGQIDGPDYFLSGGTFGIGVDRGILDEINQINPVGLVNLQTGDPTANVNISMTTTNTNQSSSNSYSSTTNSYSWAVDYQSLAFISPASSCWICDLNNGDSNTAPPSSSNNLPNTAVYENNTSVVSYYWNMSNNDLHINYAYLDVSPLYISTAEYDDKIYSKVRADLDMSKHPYDKYVEIIKSSGVELWYHGPGINSAPFAKIDTEGNVKIMAADGIYRSPSQLNSNDKYDRRDLALVASYLGKDLGIRNKGITIVSEIGDQFSSENPAWTRKPPGTEINLNRNGGFSPDFDNVNNFKSILKHEILHVDNNLRLNVRDKYESHADVYLQQMQHPSFENATFDFKSSTAHAFCNYLLNIDQDYVRKNINYDHYNKVISRINQFNLDHEGEIKIIFPEYGQYSLGNLSLSVKMNGYLPQPVQYVPQNN